MPAAWGTCSTTCLALPADSAAAAAQVHDNALVTSLGAACVQAGKETAQALQKRQALLPALLLVQALLILLQNPLNADLSGVGRQLITHISLVRGRCLVTAPH